MTRGHVRHGRPTQGRNPQGRGTEAAGNPTAGAPRPPEARAASRDGFRRAGVDLLSAEIARLRGAATKTSETCRREIETTIHDLEQCMCVVGGTRAFRVAEARRRDFDDGFATGKAAAMDRCLIEMHPASAREPVQRCIDAIVALDVRHFRDAEGRRPEPTKGRETQAVRAGLEATG